MPSRFPCGSANVRAGIGLREGVVGGNASACGTHSRSRIAASSTVTLRSLRSRTIDASSTHERRAHAALRTAAVLLLVMPSRGPRQADPAAERSAAMRFDTWRYSLTDEADSLPKLATRSTFQARAIRSMASLFMSAPISSLMSIIFRRLAWGARCPCNDESRLRIADSGAVSYRVSPCLYGMDTVQIRYSHRRFPLKMDHRKHEVPECPVYVKMIPDEAGHSRRKMAKLCGFMRQ